LVRTSFVADFPTSRKSKVDSCHRIFCAFNMAGSFPDTPKGAIPMSYIHSGKDIPRVPTAPDHAAIQRLGEELASIERQKRRRRSLQTCHRPAHRPAKPEYRHESGAYVPQFSARLLNDPNLSDGARRCAAKLLEIAYRKDREGRTFQGTVLYLAKCLRRSERAVQNYLAQLRAGGYIRHEVIRSERARMCIGIFVTLLRPIFPSHHAADWPVHAKSAGKSGVNLYSQNYTPFINKKHFAHRLSVEEWAVRCMDGVFRSFMKTIPVSHGSFA
jgi:hypothetical protein